MNSEPLVVVLFESLTGNTRRAAELIGGSAAAAGAEARVRPIDGYDPKELAQAELVFVGTWVDGLILFGHRPGRAGRIRALPALDRKKVASFCTYAVNPGKTMEKLNAILERNGAEVVASHAFRRNRIESEIDAFVDAALGDLAAASTPA